MFLKLAFNTESITIIKDYYFQNELIQKLRLIYFILNKNDNIHKNEVQDIR